jgi:carboxymethylenebutenolidase
MREQIIINAPAGSFQAHVARAPGGPHPVVVVLHEIFGVNADIRQTCDDLARQGFIAVAPDLFWRQEPGIDLGVTSEADWKKALALYGAYDRDGGVEDIVAVLGAARRLRGASDMVGLMGYCLGGLMTFLTAARSQVDAAVAFHGGDTEKYLAEAPHLTAPLLMHLAGDDEFMNEPARAQIQAAFARHPNAEIHTYPGCRHAFSRHGGAHYDLAAATLANARTYAFLLQHLGISRPRAAD